MVATILLASRFRSVTGAFGIDGAMGMHRALGAAAAAFALAHVVSVIADNPSNVWLLDVTSAPFRAVAGTVALALLATLVLLAERRSRYEWWRWLHRIVALAALVLVVLHVWLLGRLVESTQWLALFAVFASALLAAVAWRSGLLPTRRSKFIVSSVRAESETVSTVSLRPCGHRRWDFQPGQFAWLRLRSNRWSEDHPFTMSSAPDESGRVDFTIRHAGDWTAGPLRGLRPGAPVWLDGPHGAMTLDAAADASGIVAVSAGVGLAPVMSSLRALARREDPRPVWAEPLFRRDLDALAQVLDLTVLRALTRPVTVELLSEVLPMRTGHTYFVCGPPQLVADVEHALAELDVPPERVLTELFDIE